MKDLHIIVKDKIAKYNSRDGIIVCNNRDYRLFFTFDREWDEHETKTARFIWNGKYFDQAIVDNECPVPVINDATKVTVGVYAGNLATTTPAEISCLKSILCFDPQLTDGELKEYRDQAIQAAEDARRYFESMRSIVKIEKTSTDGLVDTYTIIYTDGATDTFNVTNGKAGEGGLTATQADMLNAVFEWYESQNYRQMTVSITPTGKTFELGSYNKLELSWEFSQEVSSVTLNGVAQAAERIGSKEIEIEYSPEIPQDGEFKYTVRGTRKGGQQESKSATCTIKFQNKFYRGYAADPRTSGGDLTSNFIRSLQNGFASGRGLTFDITCDPETYIWYAYPKRFGLAVPYMAALGSTLFFNGGFEEPETVTVMNNSGFAEDYYVYRSINTGLSQSVRMT